MNLAHGMVCSSGWWARRAESQLVPWGLANVELEALRVLRPGGVFAGTDSVGHGTLFRLIHIGDTLVLVDPEGFPRRLAAAGFTDIEVDVTERSFRFRGRKPA
jgi:hypothetical protein